jgi:hypothetical protein
MPEDEYKLVSWDVENIPLEELIMVIGSYIFSGNSLVSVDLEVIDRLRTLVEAEYTSRTTGIPSNTSIH